MKRQTLVLEIDLGNDREWALGMYAHFIGVDKRTLYNIESGFTFSGACVPNLFTLMRPASVTLKEEA